MVIPELVSFLSDSSKELGQKSVVYESDYTGSAVCFWCN